MSTDREALRLADIIENADSIAEYTAGMDFARFRGDRRTVDAVERCLHRLTEAVIKIGAERMAAISPTTPVDAVRGLGNLLRHEYDGIDLGVIWQTVEVSLPILRADCAQALNDSQDANG